jgi:hypothetical protein
MAEKAAADSEELRQRILQFLAHCRQPVLKEPGSEPLPIALDHLTLETKGGRLLLEAWDDSHSVVRRILRVRQDGARSLTLAVHRLGGKEGALTLADTALSGGAMLRDRRRQRFLERFAKLLALQFPGWKVERLTAERDLHRSFSEHYARAVLRRGQTSWAAIGVAEAENDAAAHILTDGLLWLDALRTQSRGVVAGLCLFVPERAVEPTASRVPFLNTDLARCQLFSFSRSDAIHSVDPANCGNLQTSLGTPHPAATISHAAREQLGAVAALAGVEEEISPQGALTLRYRGLEVARAWQEEVAVIPFPMEEVLRIRVPRSPCPRHPVYTRAPERWMESLLKTDLSVLELELAGSPVYSQTFSVAGPARGLIDLLTVDRSGRLVVIELKADQDPQLPLQALDYWVRVKWHLERGDFQARGYFPGRILSAAPPLLWLVFPAIQLHPSNEVVLKYLSPAVPVRRLGVNEDWRRGIHVIFRA